MSPELSSMDKTKPTKIGCRGKRPLRDRRINFRLFIYSHSSTNPVNFAKIGPVDFEIIGLTEIVNK